jgi:hypothetical protein
MPRQFARASGIVLATIAIALLCAAQKADDKSKPPPAKEAPAKWQPLFDGKTLGKWKPTDFGGQGESVVENGNLLLTHGEPLTGVTWQGEPPFRMNYEIELDAQRVDGSDFFCGLTFPVDKTCASLIVGGWGGSLCGISNLDDNDAANNETTKILEFKNKQWYHIRMRVEPERLQAWIDKEQIVDTNTKDKKINVRAEVESSQPLGIASFQSTAAIKNVRIRPLTEAEKAPKK